ncbi:AraC family transcriptional regulator, partial [Nocardia cyriacigeorgica]|uniref:AraC family transcriptional regulator n=1 Tax=Nocardia cyriacigeorgica TaxID=135487 RepID=UPI002457D2B0
ETTDHSLDQIAASSGLGSVETLHRAFKRQLGTTPAANRRPVRTRAAGAQRPPPTRGVGGGW